MSRKKITYQTEALYVGNTGEASPDQLHRIQSVSHDVDVQYVDINEMGRLASLSKEIVEAPVVNLDFSYYLIDAHNESKLGLGVGSQQSQNIISNFLSLNNNQEEKNYYLLTVPEGKEASDGSISYGSDNGLLGVGNGYITSYNVEAAVGAIPTASVSVEASNIRFDIDSNNAQNPAIDIDEGKPVNQTVTIPVSTTGNLSSAILNPGDIVVDFDNDLLDMGGAVLPGMTEADSMITGSACVQSISIDIPLERNPQLCLTNFHPISRDIDFPINATLSVNANLSDISSGSLNDILCNPKKQRNIKVSLHNKCKDGVNMLYEFKNAVLDSQSMSSVFDSDKTVDLVFSTSIGSASSDQGIFLKGPVTSTSTSTSTSSTSSSTSTSTSTSTSSTSSSTSSTSSTSTSTSTSSTSSSTSSTSSTSTSTSTSSTSSGTSSTSSTSTSTSTTSSTSSVTTPTCCSFAGGASLRPVLTSDCIWLDAFFAQLNWQELDPVTAPETWTAGGNDPTAATWQIQIGCELDPVSWGGNVLQQGCFEGLGPLLNENATFPASCIENPKSISAGNTAEQMEEACKEHAVQGVDGQGNPVPHAGSPMRYVGATDANLTNGDLYYICEVMGGQAIVTPRINRSPQSACFDGAPLGASPSDFEEIQAINPPLWKLDDEGDVQSCFDAGFCNDPPPTTTTSTTTTSTSTSSTTTSQCNGTLCVSNFKVNGTENEISNANGTYTFVNLGNGQFGWRLDLAGGKSSFIKRNANDFQFEIAQEVGNGHDIWTAQSMEAMLCPNVQTDLQDLTQRTYQRVSDNLTSDLVSIANNSCSTTSTSTTSTSSTTSTTSTTTQIPPPPSIDLGEGAGAWYRIQIATDQSTDTNACNTELNCATSEKLEAQWNAVEMKWENSAGGPPDIKIEETSSARTNFPIASFPVITEGDKIKFPGPSSTSEKYVVFGKTKKGVVTFDSIVSDAGYYTISPSIYTDCPDHTEDNNGDPCDPCVVAKKYATDAGPPDQGGAVQFTNDGTIDDPNNPGNLLPDGTDYVILDDQATIDNGEGVKIVDQTQQGMFATVPCSTISEVP